MIGDFNAAHRVNCHTVYGNSYFDYHFMNHSSLIWRGASAVQCRLFAVTEVLLDAAAADGVERAAAAAARREQVRKPPKILATFTTTELAAPASLNQMPIDNIIARVVVTKTLITLISNYLSWTLLFLSAAGPSFF